MTTTGTNVEERTVEVGPITARMLVGGTGDPLLYLHGLSSGDFAPALMQFLGTGSGLLASSITRLTTQWQDEARAFAARDLSIVDYVYLWADGFT